jgi:ATP-binding cassette subfamily F protein 3
LAENTALRDFTKGAYLDGKFEGPYDAGLTLVGCSAPLSTNTCSTREVFLMALIDLTDVSRFIGVRCIFSSVNLSVAKGDRIGIVGRNGEGKTTLLRVIAGELEPDSGFVHRSSGTSLGYLSQGLPDYDSTVFDEAMAGKSEVLEAASKMRELEAQMAEQHCNTEELLKEYAKVQGRFEAMGGYGLEHEVAAILAGLGFHNDTWRLPARNLSGGQKVRLNLARLLVSKPDVLLLDEPTNHLDIGGVEWLESYLVRYPGSILLVSHDRVFLDNLVGRIWEIDSGKVAAYRGNFTSYMQQKEEELRRQEEQYSEQQELIRRTQEFIRKWKANARRVGQARSREKMLERLELIDKPKKHATLRLRLASSGVTGKEVLVLKQFSKEFERALFSDFDSLILRGERVALLGPNGCGKTTFLKCLIGVEPHEGFMKWGAGVRKGYYAQDFSFSAPERTVLDEVRCLGVPERDARDVLGRFLFSGDDVKKRVRDLSGGEKSRLALVRLVLSDANVLLLDEPTNHLDLPSRRALEEAVADFEGTIIFASHDRYFIDRIATKVLYFENGRIQVFEGNYSAFRQSRQTEDMFVDKDSQRKATAKAPSKSEAGGAITLDSPKETGNSTDLDAEIECIESEITKLEEREQELASALANPDTYLQPGEIPVKEWGLVRAKLEDLYRTWEGLMESKRRQEA